MRYSSAFHPSFPTGLICFGAWCASIPAPANERRLNDHVGASLTPPVAHVVYYPNVALPADATGQPARNHTAADTLPQTDEDGVFFGIAISGGGSRSAVFAAHVLLEFQQMGLMKHVDYLSCVSGGAMTGAWWCTATDEELRPEVVRRKLGADFSGEIWGRFALPWNFARMALDTNYSRTDVLAGLISSELLSRRGRALTFADLRPGAPHLLINATEFPTGAPFVFDNARFDRCGSDLAALPLALAVCASASVPPLLQPVALRDFSQPPESCLNLMDGGVSDNLGIKSLHAIYAQQTNLYPRGAIFIIIEARTDGLPRTVRLGELESVVSGPTAAIERLVNANSAANLRDLVFDLQQGPKDLIRSKQRELQESGFVSLGDEQGRTVQILHLDFAHIGGTASAILAKYYEIPTDLAIGARHSELLRQGAFSLAWERFQPELAAMGRAFNPSAKTLPALLGQDD